MGEKKLFGYNGKIARIDLTSGKIAVEEPPEEYYQRYLGGRGFIITTLLKELKKGADPLGPENRLIFALGPITGLPLPGSGRNSVGAKSPLTGAFGESEVGGYWGAELKRAGFDALIFEGVSPKPVYLWVHDGELELRDAEGLWGLEVAQTEDAIREELGDKRIRTAIIGPGGERLISYACIINDLSHAAGRCGLGAVMGSKKLKAVAARGKNTPEMADPEIVKRVSKWMAENYKDVVPMWEGGTCRVTEPFNLAGNLPTKNFTLGFFEGAEKISGEAFHKAFGKGMHGCYACPVNCKTMMQIETPWKNDPAYGGPEYETVASFGSNCLIDDPAAICKAHDLCNRYGLDTISAGMAVSFAMECFENGILSTRETDGLELTFGNASAMVSLLENIINRKGLGDILAKGVKKASEEIGKGAEACAVHVKGLEFPMHEPRLKKALGLHMAVTATGADHNSGVHDTLFAQEGRLLKNWNMMDYSQPIVPTELGAHKARFLYQMGWTRVIGHFLGICNFVAYSPDQLVELVRGATGWPVTTYRLHKSVERSLALCRIFNLREGFSDADDRLPERFATPFKEGAIKGHTVESEKFEKTKKAYYQMLGWNDKGVPTEACMAELDIEWAKEYLP
ncbi:MAG: aldehyde ferredoxin oxidoreductase family protein [Deltaproteobacteria bacterium]|nr:aldehyde ferredoxin oxidoreductase family protein [Deltaproteobacteria bacterium]